MARSKSMKRQLSTLTRKSSNEEKIINCEAACTLQENNTLLQNTQRKMIKEFIDILSKSSKEIKTWQTAYRQVFSKNKEKLTEYEKHLWNIFNTAVSSIDLFTEKNDNIVRKLESLQNASSNQTNDQPLRQKIHEMKLTSKQLHKEITDLEKQKHKLQTKIDRQRNGAFCYTARIKVFRTDQNKPKEDLKDVLKLIKNKNKSYTNANTTYCREAADAIEQNTKAQLKLTISMKQQFYDFVKAFDIDSRQFKRALECSNPKKDLDNWKQHILYSITQFESADEEEDQDQNINHYRKFTKSPSTENENSDEETGQPLEPIKLQSIKNQNTDEKTNCHLKSRSTQNENIGKQICQSHLSIKSRSIENENSDNKTTIRQLSLRSSSVVDKNSHKKISSPQQSPQFLPDNSDDDN